MDVPVNLASLKAEDFRAFIDSFDTVITDCDGPGNPRRAVHSTTTRKTCCSVTAKRETSYALHSVSTLRVKAYVTVAALNLKQDEKNRNEGVVYNMYEPIPGAVDTLNKLKELNKEVLYLSNNTSLKVDRFHSKLHNNGLNVKKEDLILPTLAIIEYLKRKKFDKKIFFLGFDSVKEDFINAGLKIAESGPDVLEENLMKLKEEFKDDEEVGAIFVGLDVNINYMKLLKSSIYLRRPDVLFLVGTTDDKIPFGKGFVLGTGYFYRIIEDFTGRKAQIFGKPGEGLQEYVKQRFDTINPKRTIFIGDSLYQDMSFASQCGYKKLFVLTGIDKLENAYKASPTHKPDYYISSLGDLKDLIKNNL